MPSHVFLKLSHTTLIQPYIVYAAGSLPDFRFVLFYSLLSLFNFSPCLHSVKSSLTVWSAERMGEFLFDDIFKVEEVDPEGKKYDKGMLFLACFSINCTFFGFFFLALLVFITNEDSMRNSFLWIATSIVLCVMTYLF